MAVSMSSIHQLLRPAVYQMVNCARHGEDIDVYLSAITDEVVATYSYFDKATGDTVVLCNRREAEDGSFRHHVKNRVLSLFHKGRERFCVRRLVLADIEKPNLSERHEYVSTRPLRRGKYKRANSNHLPVVRIPRLLSVSPLS